MKKGFILFQILLTFITFASVSKLDKIAVVNIERIVETVFSGKSGTMQEIKAEKEAMQINLDKMKENINKLKSLALKENESSKKLKIEKKLDQETKKYSDYYKTKSYQLSKKIKNVQQPLFKEIYRVIKRVAEQDGYTLVLKKNDDSIFYYSIDIEITDKVIDFFEKHYGEKEED